MFDRILCRIRLGYSARIETMSTGRHLLAKWVGAALVLLAFGLLAMRLIHRAPWRSQASMKWTVPDTTSITLASEKPQASTNANSGLRISMRNPVGSKVSQLDSRPPKVLVLGVAQS